MTPYPLCIRVWWRCYDRQYITLALVAYRFVCMTLHHSLMRCDKKLNVKYYTHTYMRVRSDDIPFISP